MDLNTTSSISQGGVVTYLCPIAQGDADIDREGNSIKVQTFELRGAVFRNVAASATTNETVRIMVVRDLQNQGAIITGGDVLETVSTSLAPYQFIDFINGSDQNKRFSIVYDEIVCLDNAHQVRILDFRSNHDCHVFFRGQTNSVSSAGNGAYFLVVFCNTSTNTPTLDVATRIRYTDN